MQQPPIDLVRSIVLRASELPHAERDEFVARECGDDEALRREVWSFLGHVEPDDETSDWLGPSLGAPAADAFPGYRLVRELGRGGNGVVYLAQSVAEPAAEVGAAPAGRPAPQLFAIKLLSSWLSTPTASDRLRREGAALRRLDHPGIARWIETGTILRGGTESVYLVLEYIDGLNLRAHMQVIEPADRRQHALGIFAQLVEAVAHAHAQGVVHRDLKPENVIVDTEGRAKLIDFGLARLLGIDSGSMAHTQTGQIIGTLGYLSPEQADPTRGPTDARSDVYALGVLGYEMLTGTLPYPVDGSALTRTLLSIVDAEPVPASAHDRTLRGNLEWILARALEKEPRRRYADAGAMSEDLRRHLAGERVAPAALGLRRFVRGILHHPQRRARALAIAGVSAVLLSAGIAVVRDRLDRSKIESKLQTLFSLVDEMDSVRQWNESDRDSLNVALSLIRRADALLMEIPTQPYTPDFRYYLRWREGEIHYFLAGLTGETAELDAADRSWHEADNVKRIPGALLQLDTGVGLEGRMGVDAKSTPLSGLALVAAARAGFEAPRLNLLRAAERREGALYKLLEGAAEAFPYRLTQIDPEAYDRAVAQGRADLAGTYVALAALEDEPSHLDEALALFRLADASVGFRKNWEPYSALQLQRGRGYLSRARERIRESARLGRDAGGIARALADLDSARLYIPRYLASGNEPSRGQRARVAFELAACDRCEFELSAETSWLTSALRRLDDARAALGIDSPSSESAPRDLLRLEFARAQVVCDLAEAEQKPRRLAEAEATLLDIATAADSLQLPILRAEGARELGRLERIRWQLTGDTTSRQRARGHLTRAADLLIEPHHPRHHRLIREELALLAE